MKRFALSTALVLSLAAPTFALAQSAQPTDVTTVSAAGANYSGAHLQLARGLNVDPADYTTRQLQDLRSAVTENDWVRVNFIKKQAEQTDSMNARVSTSNPGYSGAHLQLANSLNVDPADYTTRQLQDLRSAVTENDWSLVNFIKNEAEQNDGVTARVSSRNPGYSGAHIQLANSLNVDPADYTTQQLFDLREAKADSDWVRYNFVLDQAGS
ncbi:hypothetical protein [Tropicimonas marinistellae]|uniref:hypothetical protein n=1 Tax=Tropicimonas marinistellae TaxID=1739787 RepID=UPI00082FA792|nr:hypothetical protein [Tropicimonas marinistellae]